MMKAIEAALVLTVLATGIHISESKHASAVRYNTEGAEISQVAVFPALWECKIDELEEEGWTLDSCEEQQTNYVNHGGMCKVVAQDSVARMSFLQTITCQRGNWLSSETGSALDHPHHRQKRGLGFGIAVGIIGCLLFCGGGGGGTEYIVKKPPTYTTCPPSGMVYYTPAGQEAVVVTWDDPVAEDSDGEIRKNEQVFGTRKGELFDGLPRSGGLQHSITYKATDDDGMVDFCFFQFRVQVRTCAALFWPHNGRRDCTHDNILGSTCNVSCNEGYSPANGIFETICTGDANPQWSTSPSCEKITCTAPPDVTDGTVTCGDGHKYGDYCLMGCDDGYTLQGQVFTWCKANGEWFWIVPTTCKDGIAPTLTCKTPQIFYAEWASSSVTAMWELPSATDNIDPAPTVSQTGGPEPGVVIDAGTSAYVTYIATDAAGNESPPCNIELRTKVTSCGHPLDTLQDNRLLSRCSTNPKYIYGDTCALTCLLNLPLEGTDLITCERNDTGVGAPVGYWDWGNGSKPFCRDIACPDMLPPRNGALVFDWIGGRPTNTMLCNQAYSLAVPELSSFNGIFICQDSGAWNPYYEKAPDCSEQYTTRGYKLPSDFFYYEGVCGVNDNILANFENIVANLDTIFAALCPDGTVCETTNPKVTCGEYRKKRSAHSKNAVRRSLTIGSEDSGDIPHILKKREAVTVLAVYFEIEIRFDTSQMTDAEQWDFADYVHLEVLKPAVQEAVLNGTFDRPGWAPLDNFATAEYGDPVCDPGSVVVLLTKCSECPAGHFESDGACMKCPVGEYCESGGCPLCEICPDGYSTRGEASESVDNCTQLCEPGTYSPDTFVPCAQCPTGFYQPETGQTHCIPCPMGTSTKSAGSLAEAACEAYDAIVADTGDYALTFDIPMLTNLGLEFFIKAVSGTPNIVISVNGELDVTIADTIIVSTASTSDDIGEPSDDAWIQVSIYWDVATGEFRAFYRGTLAVSHSSIYPTVTPLAQNGHMYISASGNAVAISGLRLQDAVIGEAETITATTCQNLDATDIINMEDLKYVDEITLLVPSVCDVVDECLSSPCGNHSSRCTNFVDGFMCTCKGGWTGDTCDTPPDYCPGNNCQNGATCVSGLTNYTCQCHPGFSGVNCERPPVDGGWSVWARWTECSTTCDTGSRERTRSCDSPVPDPHGQDCVGADIETEDCNTSPCPECPAIERGEGVLPKCNVDSVTGTQVCTAICVFDGHVQPPGLGNDTYTCGIETDYKWQPRKKIPGCSKPSSPRRLEVKTSATLDQPVPSDDKQNVISGITSNVDSTPCHNSNRCTVGVELGIGGRRKKRNTGTTVTITFSIALNDTSDLQLDQYVQNGTVSPGLQEIIDAINNLEATAIAINDSASTYFDVTTNGVTYTVDANTVTLDGAANCSDGQVVTDGLCAECPAGSYQVGDYCSLCDKGTYQDQTGQAECVHCPYGFTTETVGSDASTDCSVPETTTTSSTPSTTTSTTSTTQSSSTSTTSTTPSSSTSTTSTTSTTPSSSTSTTSTMSTTPSSTTSTTSTTQSSSTSTTQYSTSSTTLSSTTSTSPSSTTSTTSTTQSSTSTTQTSTSTTQSSTSTTQLPNDDESDDGLLMIVIIAVSVLVVLIIGVIAAIVCIMKHNAGRSKIADSTPDLRAPDPHGMVNPVYNIPPMSAFMGKPASSPPRPPSVITVRDLEFDVDPFKEHNTMDDNTLYS